jgi:hypothetical protein
MASAFSKWSKLLKNMFYPSLLSGGGLTNLSTSLEAGQARADARQAQTSVELMQHDIDRLLMLAEAMWTFLKAQHNYTDEDLVKAITEIEMRDGESTKHQPVTCPACGRMNSGKRPICIYCGKPIPMNPFAR